MFEFNNLGEITDLREGLYWSKEQLLKEIANRTEILKRENIGSGAKVFITHGGTPQFFADLFAVWSLGACALCVNETTTQSELTNLVQFVEPELILFRGEKPTLGINRAVPMFDITHSKASTSLPSRPPHSDDDCALILFTSGSTGDPKGVVHTSRSICERLLQNQRWLPTDILRNTLCLLPTHFGHGLIGNTLTALTAGAHLFLLPNPGVDGLARLGKTIDENRISFMSSVPAMWKVATRISTSPVLGSLKQINIGSAPLAKSLWDAVVGWSDGAEVVNMYGITETANWFGGASSKTYQTEDGLVGVPWGGEAAVFTPEGNIERYGNGELLLATPSVMSGYLKRPDLTAEVLKDGWYFTGDRGEIDTNGVIRLTGRLKTQINRAGEKILPEEIDLLLEQHPAIDEACAFGVPDPIQGEAVGIALCANRQVSEIELRNWCTERIRGYCIPEKWFFVDTIPKTERGKVQRANVRQYCLEKEDG